MLNLSPGLGAFLVLVALILVVVVARFSSKTRRTGKNDAASWWMHSDTNDAVHPERDNPSSHGTDHGGESGSSGESGGGDGSD